MAASHPTRPSRAAAAASARKPKAKPALTATAAPAPTPTSVGVPARLSLLSLAASLVEFALLPLLGGADEAALSVAVAVPVKEGPTACRPRTTNFASLFCPSSITSRSLWRASQSLLRAAARDAAIYSAHAANAFSPEDAETFRAAAAEATQLGRHVNGSSGSGSGSRNSSSRPAAAAQQRQQQVVQAWQARGVTEEPLILNLVHLFTKLTTYAWLQDRAPATEQEADDCHVLLPGAIAQLRAGNLVLPAALLRELQERLTGGAAAAASAAAAAVGIARPLSLSPHPMRHLSVALDRLLSLASELRSAGCVWTYCQDPYESKTLAAQYQIHPFLLRWPTDRDEWNAALRQHFSQFDDDEVIAALGPHESGSASASSAPAASPASASPPDAGLTAGLGVAAGSWRCCGGATNPDAAADDEAFRVLIGGTTDADGNYVPPDAAHQTDECIWACPLVCPPAHCRLCPAEGRQKVHFPSACRCARIAAFCEGAASFCADHLQTVRGCLWYHCARSIHVCRQMVMRMVGVDADYRGHNTNNQPRPGIRNDWSEFFAAVRPFVLGSQIEAGMQSPLGTDSPLSQSLRAALPWSLECGVGGHRILQPAPIMVAAPMAHGWVGGFIAGANRNRH